MKFANTSALALLLGTAAFFVAPASAGTSVSVSVGPVGIAVAGSDCDDYYEPPWGYPPDYCNYEVYDQPVYVGGVWYRGPIYWRYDNGVRVFWVNGAWRRHEWVGPMPRHWRWGHRGFMTWHGKTHFGRHSWVIGGHNNWHPRHGGHGGDGHGGHGDHGGHGGHGGHDDHGGGGHGGHDDHGGHGHDHDHH